MLEAQDYFAIQNLLFSYPYALDRGDFDAVGALFADALVRNGDTVMGDHDAAAVARSYRDWVILHEDGTPRTRHMLANVRILPESPTRAVVQSYVMVFQQAGDAPLQTIIGGDYRDTVEKKDGEWRFVERVMGNDLVGDLTRHGKDRATIREQRANA